MKKGGNALKTLLIAGIVLLFLPVIITGLFQQVGSVVDAATAAAEGVAPKLAGLMFVCAGIAASVGGLLHAFGHGRGKKMLRGSIEAVILTTLIGAGFVWLSRQGPTLATNLVDNLGVTVTNMANRIPGLG